MDEVIQNVSFRFPCREKIIHKLYQYYCTDDPFPPALYMYGQTSTGKWSIVNEVLDEISYSGRCKYVTLNAISSYTNKILFETIAMGLMDYELGPENDYKYCRKLEYMKDFLAELQLLDPLVSYIIAIKNAERLRDMRHNILPMFLQLPEATGLNISVVLISYLPFEKFFTKTGLPPVVKLFVPEYTRDEMQRILLNDFNEIIQEITTSYRTDDTTEVQPTAALTEYFYKNYISIFLGTFWKVCRDAKELRLVAKECFKPYYAPVLDGTIDAHDSMKLWHNISKVMKTSLGIIYMRIGTVKPTEGQQGLAQNIELPYYAKYLLIAAYLASHNAAKEDRRLFMKNHGKQKKRLQSVKARAKVSEKMATQLGPKTFNIDRLLAIFYAILDEKVGLTCNLLAQISTLVHLKFLTFTSTDAGVLDGSARLQCTVGMDFILQIGRMVGFNVRQYLCDFF
ncbi:origin recognition complex subunit 5 [Anopheles nili]|uniref:origin recognition complex subunit 5 n=1 Tax=Anopheles nili TaxID=185578 RepID=UPI00237C24D9|nr:origin recognition complex subunit 5 [Anopheles nili]